MNTLAERNGTSALHQQDWPLRPWVLALLLALCGLAAHVFLDFDHETPWRMAAGAFFVFGGLATAFTLEPREWKESSLFALIVGLAMAGLAYNAIDLGDRVAGEEYSFAAGVFAAALAIPLFQAGFHRLRWRTDYAESHYFVWTDAICAGGALAFTLLSWLLLWLLNSLFKLVDITIIEDLIHDEWIIWIFCGATFGAALGVLRNQLGVLGTLQRVVMLVFSILAVPLAVALVLFLIPLVLSGGEALWSATRNATPVLLSCAAGAFVLVNAVIRDSDKERSANRIMQIGAAVLAAGILPLAIFAAISMVVRVGQYGLAPERIWGLVAIAVALAFGSAYCFGLIRGGVKNWCTWLRKANFVLAIFVCGLALFLALPIINFGAVSARNQLARLHQGAVSAEDFDYDALRWDFGKPGRDALAFLAKGDDPTVAKLAKEALERNERLWRFAGGDSSFSRRKANLKTEVADQSLLDAFDAFLFDQPWRCNEVCTFIDLGRRTGGKAHYALVEGLDALQLEMNDQGKLVQSFEPANVQPATPSANPVVEVRPYTGRQIYVDGRPVGQPFE